MHFVLDIPWNMRPSSGVQYWKSYKALVYKGAKLPKELADFRCEDYTYEKWVEDELNGIIDPVKPNPTIFKPKPHQVEAGEKILASFKSGDRGFLEADKTGVGKTLSTLHGVTLIAREQGFSIEDKAKLLIVCPKGVIPQWRNTLKSYPPATFLTRPLVINYERLNLLLQEPINSKMSKKRSTKNRNTAKKGTPTIDWDFIIFDEAHKLKNYGTSLMAFSASNIAKLEKNYVKGKTPYVIYSTATPGASPLNLACMSGVIAPLLSGSKNPNISGAKPSQWGDFLQAIGFHVNKDKSGKWNWVKPFWAGKGSKNPSERLRYDKALKDAVSKQRADSKRIGRALMQKGAPFIMRKPTDIAGWEEQQYIPLPIELSSSQRVVYLEAWRRFRNFLQLEPRGRDPKTALVENLRYRQKSSLLKVSTLAEIVEEFVKTGNQVFISCEFVETISEYKKAFDKMKIPYSIMSGEDVADREDERIKFQKGISKVVLCTITAGISLHAGEVLPDGTKATESPRITIVHSVRQNPLDTIQILGRAHRDGQNSIAYFPYLEKTVDEKVIDSFINKQANMKGMLGESDYEINFMERLFLESARKNTPGGRLS